MKKTIAALATVSVLGLALVTPASAGSATDAALALGAFAVFNQLVARPAPPVVYSPPPVVYAPPPVVYTPPPPAVVYAPAPPVVYAPPPVVYAPVRPVVVYPRGYWVHGHWVRARHWDR